MEYNIITNGKMQVFFDNFYFPANNIKNNLKRGRKMLRRTDLALEQRETAGDCPGIESDEEQRDGIKITRIRIVDEQGERAVGKPMGNYITVEADSLEGETDGTCRKVISDELAQLLPGEGTVLVAGLGNFDITPDALGPKTASQIFATRHIDGNTVEKLGISSLRPVCVLSPGVLGKTGIETAEIIRAVADKIKPSAVVAVDALAARELSRLGRTVQISDTGICPGSGVGNSRKEISQKRLGVPVIAVGVPTVVDAETLAEELTGKPSETKSQKEYKMMVTPREIDSVIDHAADLVALSINCALQKELSAEEICLLI